jgi:hypothetical protein
MKPGVCGHVKDRSMTDIKVELNIPDLWYDFYARLLPGAIFVAAIYFLWPDAPSWPTALQTVMLLAAGYVSALVSQPVASELTWGIEWLVAGMKHLYVERIAQNVTPHESQILSKMHSEVTFFTQCIVLSIALWVLLWVFQLVPRFQLKQEWGLTIAAVFAFVGLAALTAFRRKRRADRMQELHSKIEG